MKVELWYVEGCPHWTVAESRLRDALDMVGRQDPVLLRRIETLEESDRIGFVGSPTIRLDDQDPFLPAASSRGLTCRLYVTERGLTGAPTVEQLVEILEQRDRTPRQG